MPYFDYLCPECGIVATDVLVKQSDEVVRCMQHNYGVDQCPIMKRLFPAPPRYLDHTVDDGYGSDHAPDSFRPIQVGMGGSRKANWRNKKDG